VKLAVLADIHGNAFALDAVLQDMQAREVSDLVYLGDLVMFGPEPAAVFQTMKGLNPLYWLKGNTDMWLQEPPDAATEQVQYHFYLYAKEKLADGQVRFLTDLTYQGSINYQGVDILCVHGSPRSVTEIMDRRTKDQHNVMLAGVTEEIVVCGHSHVPYLGEAAGKKIFNVGSVGRPLDGDTRAAYGIIDLSGGKPEFINRRVGYDLEETLTAARKYGMPNLELYEHSLRNASG